MGRGRSALLLIVVLLAAASGWSASIGAAAATASEPLEAAETTEAGANTFRPLTPTRLLDTRFGAPFGPGELRNLQVSGVAGIPSSAVAVVVNVTVTGPTAAGFVSVFPAGTPFPGTSNLNYGPGETVANLVMIGLGSGGQLSLLQVGGAAHVIADVQGWFSGSFTPVSPVRVLDTRANLRPFGPGEVRRIDVGGRSGVPASASAVVLNLTATGPTAGGWLSAFPSDTAFPGTSNLNFGAGQTVANLVVVGLGNDDRVSLLNATGATHVIADVLGYLAAGFRPVTPARLADTRAGVCGLRLGHGDTRSVAILDRGGLPASGLAAVAVNVTATGATAASFLTVYPKGVARPGTSNLNLARGGTVPNLVVSGVGTDGALSIYNAAGTVDLIVDVTGWFEGTSSAAPRFDCAVLPAQVLRAPPGAAFPPGLFAVPSQVAPGRYVAAGGPSCTWQRISAGGQVAGTGGGGPRALLDVHQGDVAVLTSGCGNWVAHRAPLAPAPAVGDGDWVVSEELLPGVYASSAAAPCRWEQLMGFAGTGAEQLDEGLAFGVALVELAPFEVGFRSRGCGVWRWLGPPVG